MVLWVRSYWSDDVVYGWLPVPLYLQLNSVCGDLKLIANAESQQPRLEVNARAPESRGKHWNWSLRQHPRFRW